MTTTATATTIMKIITATTKIIIKKDKPQR